MIQLKFVDNIGSVEYLTDLQAVQVTFGREGNEEQHIKTMLAAENLSQVYDCHSFLIQKPDLNQDHLDAFEHFIVNWLFLLDARSASLEDTAALRVALVVSHEVFVLLSGVWFKIHLLDFKNVIFHVSTSSDNAAYFLNHGGKSDLDDYILGRFFSH